MSLREWLGLILTVVAFVVAPFGYWLSPKWYLVALLLGAPGIILFFTARNARKFDPTVAPDADIYPGTGELRGFRGGKVLDSFPDLPGDD